MSEKKACGLPAKARMYWPGREPLDVCGKHGLSILAIATALDMYIHTDPIRDTETTCSQRIPKKE